MWDVRSDTVRYGDGEIVRQYVDHPGAAAIVAMDDDDRVLLIQQYRHPIRHRDWEIPAGLLDIAGESPLETAQRELMEEADLVAADWQPLVSVFTDARRQRRGGPPVPRARTHRGRPRARARGRGSRHPHRVGAVDGCRRPACSKGGCATASWRRGCSRRPRCCAARRPLGQRSRAEA